MKILYVSDHPRLYTSLGETGRELCNRLSSNYDVKYIGLFPPQEISKTYQDPLMFHVWPTKEKGDKYGEYSIPKAIDLFKPDVLLTVGDIEIFRHVAYLKQRKNVAWVHWASVTGIPVKISSIDLLRNVDNIVTFSEWGKDILLMNLPSKGAHTIYPGVDMSKYYPKNKYNTKNEFGIIDKFVIGAICPNEQRKNIPSLMRILSLFLGEYTVCDSCRGLMFGRHDGCKICGHGKIIRGAIKDNAIMYLHTELDSPNGWNIDELSKIMNVSPFINFPTFITFRGAGYDEEMFSNVINTFDVFLSVSGGDSFGFSLLKAMACGVPTIATDCSGYVEWAKNDSILASSKAFYSEARSMVNYGLIDEHQAIKALDFFYYDQKWEAAEKYNISDVESVVCGDELNNIYSRNGIELAKKFSWEYTAIRWNKYLSQVDITNKSRNIMMDAEKI